MSTPAANLKIANNQRPVIPNLLTVASGKGGVGKTWFAISLAHALAFQGKRVLLFDGDLGLANVDVQLGLTPEKDLGNVIAGRATFQEAITPFNGGSDSVANFDPYGEPLKEAGFDVLAGRSGSGTLGSLTRSQLSELIHGLKNMSTHYDYVICDLAAGIDNAAKMLSTPSSKIYVVLTDEPTSLTDAYAYIKIMAMRFPDIPIEVVVNMASDRNEGKRTFATLAKACENFLDFEPRLAGIILRDEDVKRTIRQQSPILRRFPHAQATGDVREISQKLLK